MAEPTLRVRIARKTAEAQDICSLELHACAGTVLPAFSAGAHIDVHLPNGKLRQYSLCNAPCSASSHADSYRIAVLREPQSRGGSQAVHELLKEGDEISISAPRNHFALSEVAARHKLFAGGIGITPILSMAQQLQASGADFELHYAARSAVRMAFVEQIQGSPFASRVQLHVDDGAPEQKLNLAAELRQLDTGTHLYVCGPQGFMNAVLDTARSQGWPDEQLHWEFFSAADNAVPRSGDEAFEVQLASSGTIVIVQKNQSVVEALAACGVSIETSCEQGVCGTCLTRVVGGEIDHRDMFMTPAEHAANDQFTPCCSRAKSERLVLDL